MSARIRGLASLRRKLGILNDAERAAGRIEVKRGLLNIQNDAKVRVKKDRGELANSISHETATDGLSGRVGTNKRHGPVVEFGRRAGSKMPPLDEIRDWAVRHGIPAEAAYPIARKIAEEGIPPAPFLFPAFERERPRFVRRLRKVLDRAHRQVSR